MIIYGASGHGKVIIDILEAMGKPLDFVVDDNPHVTQLLGYEVRRNEGSYDEAIVSIGSPTIRKQVVDALQVTRYATAVHPSALISPRAVIGEGTVVMHGAVVQSCARVGKHCIVNTGASVDHDCQLSDYVHIAPHATLSGNVQVGEGSWVGVGAVVKQGIRIGAWCTIGAGAVVVRDVPDGATVVGVPARVIKQNDMNTSVLKVTKSGGVKCNSSLNWLHTEGGLAYAA